MISLIGAVKRETIRVLKHLIFYNFLEYHNCFIIDFKKFFFKAHCTALLKEIVENYYLRKF